MLNEVVAAALQTLSLQPTQVPQRYQKTPMGDYDAIFPGVRTAEREGHFFGTTLCSEQHIFGRAGDVLEIADLPSMVGRRFAIRWAGNRWRFSSGWTLTVNSSFTSPGLSVSARLPLLKG
jgi:hypothetical protein